MDAESEIRNVAIYLRKSREEADDEDVLSKHRNELVALADNNKWQYSLYEEIKTGEKIAYRPIMQQLLDDVETGRYDAVLVMDIDRLSRGDNKDWGTIIECFCNDDINAFIVTPQKTYDLREDLDDMIVGFQALFAKVEYKTINKRLQGGKIGGAKKGLWTNGKPPYPYYYEASTKSVLVNREQEQIYRLIIDKYLAGESTRDIMLYLNQNKIKTPKGNEPDGKYLGWSQNVITRLLTSQVHLGNIVYGKTKAKKTGGMTASGNPRKRNITKESDRWIVTEGKHRPLKTPDEHAKIMAIMRQRATVAKRARQGTHILSGLMFCGKCGHALGIKRNSPDMVKNEYVLVCGHLYKDGSKCNQRGRKLDKSFYDVLLDNVVEVDEHKLAELRDVDLANAEAQKVLSLKQTELVKTEQALTRIHESYEEGTLAKIDWLTRKEAREQQRARLAAEIRELYKDIGKTVMTEDEFKERIATFSKRWHSSLTEKEKNEALRSLVHKIIYDRNTVDGEDIITLSIDYH